MHPLTPHAFDPNPHRVTRVLIETADGTVLEFEPTAADQVALSIGPDDHGLYQLDLTPSGEICRVEPTTLRVALDARLSSGNRAPYDPALHVRYDGGRAAVVRPDGTPFTPGQPTTSPPAAPPPWVFIDPAPASRPDHDPGTH